MQKILFALMLILAFSACVFANTVVYQENFSTDKGGWEGMDWDEQGQRGRVISDTAVYIIMPDNNMPNLLVNKNWVISFDLIVYNSYTGFDKTKVLPSFYLFQDVNEYELYFTNAAITETMSGSYTTYSYSVDGSTLAAGYYNTATTDIDELLAVSYADLYLNWNVDKATMEAISLTEPIDNKIYLDNISIVERTAGIEDVPEPATMLSLLCGLIGFAGVKKAKK